MDYQKSLILNFVHHENRKKVFWLMTAFFLGIAALQTGQDFLHAHINSYRGYLAESLVFKIYWVLFIPVVTFLFVYSAKIKPRIVGKLRWVLGIIAVVILSALHILLVAGLIVVVSELFFYSPFPFRTPFRYFASEHFYLTMFFYAAGIAIAFRHSKESDLSRPFPPSSPPKRQESTDKPLTFVFVSIQNKLIPIATKDIVCIQADRPYINIHTSEGKYLHTDTLKEMQSKLGNDRFVRIHRSTIINREFVKYIKSRSNGDYDITLTNGEAVRMSRNYYTSFRDGNA
jgi:hypothetical protein